MSEALDSELPPELLAELPQGALQSGGFSTMVVGAAEYAHNRRQVRIGASAQTAFRYYNRLNRLDPVAHSGGVGADIRLAQNANLLLEQSAAYSPSYLFQLFPATGLPMLGETIPTAPDYRLVQSDSYSYRSNVSAGVGSQRGTRVTATGGYHHTDFRGELADRAGAPQLESYEAGAGISRGVRRNVRLLGGYEYRTSDFGTGDIVEHRFSIGADYSRALSTTRRANFRIRLTPSTLYIPESSANPVAAGRLNRLQAEGTVEYQFRRTWLAAGTYQRGVEYLAVLAQPLLSDGGRLSVEGLLTRRLDLLATMAYVRGASALDLASRIDSSTANVRVRYALSRNFALYSEYVYFKYDLGARQSLAPNLPREFTQHGLRAGGAVWASVF